jgi:hypothetical protein
MVENRELKEFASNLETEVIEHTHENSVLSETGVFQEQAFTELVCNYLVEYGETEDVDLCFFDRKYGRGIMRVNAYCVSETAGRIVLVATLFRHNFLTTIHRKDIVTAIQRAVRVFEAASNDFHELMEPATDAYSMVQRISQVGKNTRDLQVLVLTNGLSVGTIDEVDLPSISPSIRWQIWDMVRLSRCISSGKTYESISIDLSRMPTGPLPCLKMRKTDADYDAYMVIIPGDLLYRLYDEHGPKLLELNVRSFLQARGKVNRGIRDTIRDEPARFLAYNNGISATAEKIEIEETLGQGLQIKTIEGFQVVNGGQTMASIHRARSIDQSDLDSVFVQAKITIIKPEQISEIVPKISRFANTQNKVNEADFSSNDPFHVAIERLSKKIWCPGEQSRWFYERARGQYQVARTRHGTTKARRAKFDVTTPRKLRFGKTDLAKYFNSWEQFPYLVSLGNQKNFVKFMGEIQKEGLGWEPADQFYRNLIAKAIIFKAAEKIARQHGFPSYRANAITYTVALLSYRTVGRVNLNQIWKDQDISRIQKETIFHWMRSIWEEIIESAGERNVTEWCKKEECWRTIQILNVSIPQELQDELAEGQPLPTVGSSRGQKGIGLSHQDRENIAKTMQFSGEEWLQIHKWATAKGQPNVMIGIALTLSSYAANEWRRIPSAKQAKQAVRMLTQVEGENLFSNEST